MIFPYYTFSSICKWYFRIIQSITFSSKPDFKSLYPRDTKILPTNASYLTCITIIYQLLYYISSTNLIAINLIHNRIWLITMILLNKIKGCKNWYMLLALLAFAFLFYLLTSLFISWYITVKINVTERTLNYHYYLVIVNYYLE